MCIDLEMIVSLRCTSNPLDTACVRKAGKTGLRNKEQVNLQMLPKRRGLFLLLLLIS